MSEFLFTSCPTALTCVSESSSAPTCSWLPRSCSAAPGTCSSTLSSSTAAAEIKAIFVLRGTFTVRLDEFKRHTGTKSSDGETTELAIKKLFTQQVVRGERRTDNCWKRIRSTLATNTAHDNFLGPRGICTDCLTRMSAQTGWMVLTRVGVETNARCPFPSETMEHGIVDSKSRPTRQSYCRPRTTDTCYVVRPNLNQSTQAQTHSCQAQRTENKSSLGERTESQRGRGVNMKVKVQRVRMLFAR